MIRGAWQRLAVESLRVLDTCSNPPDATRCSTRPVHEEARQAELRRFPYSVICALREDGILVIVCSHARRNPKRWQDHQ